MQLVVKKTGENAIKCERRKRGMTQREAAERAGVSVRTLQRYESGERDCVGMIGRIFFGAFGLQLNFRLEQREGER